MDEEKMKYSMHQHIRNIRQRVFDFQIDGANRIWRYIVKNLIELELLGVLFIVLQVYTYIPYVNLIVAPWMIYFVCGIVAKFLLRIPLRNMLYIVLILFVFAMMFTLRGNVVNAEAIGNVIYGLLWYIGIAALRGETL